MEEDILDIGVDFRGCIERCDLCAGEPPEVIALRMTADEGLLGIAYMGAVDEINVLMFWFSAFLTGGNSLEEEREGFL